jgi:outer membrane murein-binding lipoprotein Lpp
MTGMIFVIVLLSVLFCGIGGIMMIGTRAKQHHDERTLGGGADPDAMRQLARAVESLQGQVSDLSERMDFTERLLEAPKGDADRTRS